MTQTQKNKSLIGAGFMLAAMGMLPFLDVVAKTLGQQGMPVIEIVWGRMFFGALMTLPFAVKIGGRAALIPDRPIYHTFRSGLLIGATFFFFFALKYLPIADALAIFFVNPLVVTALSPFVLGETVGPQRKVAVAIGFIGTLIIIRPGFQEINPGTILALASGVCLASYFLMTRRISGQANAVITTFHTGLVGTVITSLIVLTVWQPPSDLQWALLVLVGLISTLGHLMIVRAYDFAEASLLAPLAYTEIIMATVAGWWFFGDFPDFWTFVGVGVLIACAIYISVNERQSAVPGPDYEQP